MKTNISVVLAFCALLCLGARQAWGDVLYLSDGRKVEGIIADETDVQVRVQVLWQGYVTIPRGTVLSIERGAKGDHQRLLEKWKKDFLVDQKQEGERKAFEETQRAKGLVPYQGKWMTAEEASLLEEKKKEKERQKKAEEERQQLEEGLRRINERLQALEEENERLRRQLAAQTEIIFRRSNFINVHRRDSTLFKDEQGNLIRVQEHENHKFFTTSDGEHVNLEADGDHLSFTDEKGVHHDLKRVWH